jgi:hypothetical protein
MLIRAPAVGFRVEGGRVNARDFEKWARETRAVANDGTPFATDAEAAALANAAQAAAISSASASLAAHVADADPHTQYLTQTEGDGFYLPVGTTTTGIPEGTNQYFTGSRARAACRLWTVRAVTTTTSASTSDDLITGDATSGAFSVNLPALASSQGMRVMVKKIDASGNAVTIDANSTEQIDGATTRVLAAQWDSVTLVAGPSMWLVVA